MINNPRIFILGVNGFPYGSARIEKLKLIGKGLRNQDCSVRFIGNSWGIFKKNELPGKGVFEGMEYIYTCRITHRPNSFWRRRYYELFGFINEIRYLLNHKCDAAVVSVMSGMFFTLFKYWIISRIKGYKIYYPHHEEENVSLENGGLIKRLNLYFFKILGFKIIDGAFPISTYLRKQIVSRNPNLPQLVVPPMTDFDFFDKARLSRKTDSEKYFLYCGSMAYFEVIEFILEAFEKLENNEFHLYIISFGCKKKEPLLKQRIQKSSKPNRIKHFGYLEYEDLVSLYINANGLLIPLRETVQDIARFPHKISEYCASRNPILTNCVGDVPKYLKHQESVLFAKEFSVESYSELMRYVVNNPQESNMIGKGGYNVGKVRFDYKSYELKIKSFIGV